MNGGLFAFPKQALALTASPYEAWDAARESLSPRAALVWQMAAGAACAAALAARAEQLEISSPVYSGSSVGILLGLTLTAQLAAYLLYIIIAAVVAYVLLRPLRPRTSYRDVLAVVSYSTFPLLVAWVFRATIAWTRSGSHTSAVDDFHSFVEAVWSVLTVRTDLGILWLGSARSSHPVLGALDLFWIWHGVSLWRGLRGRFGRSSAWTILVLVVLAGLVAIGQGIGHAFGSHWREIVRWTD